MAIAMPRFELLWTDVVVGLLLLAALWGVRHAWRVPHVRATWRRVFADPAALCSAVVLGFLLLVAVADSVHFRRALPGPASQTVAYDARTTSLLDALLSTLVDSRESSYSAPLAWHTFGKESQTVNGQTVREVARLQHGGAHLREPVREWAGDVSMRTLAGLGWALVPVLLAWACGEWWLARQRRAGRAAWLPLRPALCTLAIIMFACGVAASLMPWYHVLGTDRTGNDVLYQALKSVRTAFVIGSLSSIATLPLAVGLGILAGYLRGWADDVIQYGYTLLSSVPNVLLIAACVLMMQGVFDQHPDWFETTAQRSDIRLFVLCVILGVTGWAGLCRLVRAETIKLRELDYVQAAQAFGVGAGRIMARHVFPNVLHLVLITTVLDFSALILYEAVLSYVGVGVDPAMNSFGGMINLARSEMSRDPVVWWSFATAFVLMVVMVLAANLFADGVREAFDPRGRLFKPSGLKRRTVRRSKLAAGEGA